MYYIYTYIDKPYDLFIRDTLPILKVKDIQPQYIIFKESIRQKR